jgi:hypothetical protein
MQIDLSRFVDRQRYLIVGTGRSGSTALAAVLAGAGANFSMSQVEAWDYKAGEYEHPMIHRARRWQSRAEKVQDSLLPNRGLYAYCLRQMRKAIHGLLDHALYAKSSDLVWLVHPIFKEAFWPRIIVSYRPFEEYARSRYIRYGFSMADVIDLYKNVYSTAAIQLSVFGGCAVNYDDLVDANQTAWADALAQLTGLERDALLASREQYIRAPTPKNPPLFDLMELDASMAAIYAGFEAIRGRVLDPAT